MSIRDGYSNFKFFQMLAPTIYSSANMSGAAGDMSSSELDTQGYETATIVVNIYSCAVASDQSAMAIRLMHADVNDSASYADVSADDVFGSAWSVLSAAEVISFGGASALVSGIIMNLNISTTSTADCNSQWIFGYKGTKRYIKLMVESTGSVDTGSAKIQALGILGLPANWPVNVLI